MRVDSSGRLGLGTSSPGAKLQVSQNTDAGTAISAVSASASTSLTTDYATLFLQNTNTTNNNYNAIGFVNDQGGYSSAIYGIYTSHTSGAQSGALAFSTRNAGTFDERMRITAAGRVGIGTTSPGSLLEVAGKTVVGSTSSNALEVFSSGDTEIGFSYATRGNIYAKIIGDITNASPLAGEIAFQTATGGSLFDRARIDSSGRLLVGTSTSPSAGQGQYSKLVALGGAGTTYGNISFGSTAAATSISSGDNIALLCFTDNAGNNFARIDCAADAAPGSNDYPGRLVFSTTADGASSPTERMRITNDGQSRFGNNPTGAGDRLLIEEIDPANGYCIFTKVTGTGTKPHVRFGNGNGLVGSITTNGTATSYATSSDYRLKENVVPLTGAIDRLQQIPVHRFNFIADPDKILDGFIAHEAQAIVPECVIGDKDAVDDEGNPVYQGIDQSKLVPLLTAALQEALVKIETLEARLTAAGI